MPQAHTYLLVACGLSLCADGFLTTRPLRHRQVALNVIETDDWLTAQDAEGRTYYYHAVTMETSWTDPRIVVEEPPAQKRQQLHSLHILPSNVDPKALSNILANSNDMDEAQTEEAFWSVVNEVDRAEAHDEPLSADVPRMLHKIFDADLQHLLTREQIRTNLTCMQPALTGAANAGNSMGYIMDDYAHKDLPLKEGAYLGVPSCRDAFTPSTRVVARRGGREWFLFQF